MIKWFGKDWGSPLCQETEQVPTPLDAPCLWCGEAIVEGDDGITMPHVDVDGLSVSAFHLDCYVRTIVGGLNHLRGQCTCCGGSFPPDPPDLSRRVSARLAAAYRNSK